MSKEKQPLLPPEELSSLSVVHLIPTMKMGGAQKVALNLANRTTQRNIKCTILALDRPNISASVDSRGLAEIVHLGYRGGLSVRDIPSILIARSRLRKLIQDLKPTIIHSHLFMSKPFLIGNVPDTCTVIDTIHDNLPWWERSDWRSRIMRMIDRRFYSGVASFSPCISNSVRQQASKALKTSIDRLPLIYNFVETPPVKTPKTPPTETELRLLVISRLQIRKKGLDTALKIVNSLKNTFPTVHLTIVGDGPDRTQLENIASHMGIANHITFTGMVQNVLPYLDEMHLLIMPSRWEGFGLTAIEAGMRGVPVIASRVGGLAEVVLDRRTGRLCPPNDYHAFVSAITEIIESPDTYSAYSEQATDLTQQRFSPETAFDRYLELYTQGHAMLKTARRR